MYVLSLVDCHVNSKEQVGSKAMNLSIMKKAFASIPDGFVVTSESFGTYLKQNQIDLEQKETIRESILCGVFPEEVEKEITCAYESLVGTYDAVAVRSSSAMEDLEGASFAGQYETILNVTTKQNLFDSIKRCWASYFSSDVQNYASNHDVALEDLLMGVFVQGMVDAEVSGVIFSANPVTGNAKEVLINASYGLGEAIVDGSVTPDMYIVGKETNQVMKELGDKDIQVVRTDNGNETVAVPSELQSAFCLEGEEVRSLTDLTVEIENYFKHPVDIEFAISKKDIYILQARPITTLKGEHLA
ncbi:PEP/pyruvate-binding domain-containing protein [Halalkalibacter alkaliphilus]|uniref:PEP/pyruvate-binding domain-containing protein n=1 Tax=Halalkalibacter alkaliphilus TaxID=2917993 RepID=A0A9X1ZWJ2_9BACI|nr:PEP/pyruvate-binding domain-containing protein [Halalkalibacter alkaliphilus]MCL7746829.1 PEP/pyruvate-binding domain-containing protein [Halalkalibacter alkaliphilus]